MAQAITEYFLIPVNNREQVMSFGEFCDAVRAKECSNVAIRTDDETLRKDYEYYVRDCEKYTCTDIEIGTYITTKENMEKDFRERILPQYPSAIKDFS